jgi:hypothetical protein
MKRDYRLLIALTLLLGAAIGIWIEIQYLIEWSRAYWGGNWQQFSDRYSIPIRQNCYDCEPSASSWAGTYSIVLFIAGFAIIALAWWKPRR